MKNQYMATLGLLRQSIEYAEEDTKNQALAEPMEQHDASKNATEPPLNITSNNEVIHIKLCSNYNHQFGLTLHLLEQKKLLDQDLAFKNFHIKTIDFLQNTYNLTSVRSGMENVGFQFQPITTSKVCPQIQEFCMLEVTYESQVHWYTECDLLCANPDFQGNPCYDSVMVDTENGPAFAKLIFLFSLKQPTHVGTIQLGLICYYMPISPQMCPNTDKVIRFRQFKLCDEANSSIISLESVIQGVSIAPLSLHNSSHEYFVNDLIDGNIFVCMKQYNAQPPQF
jgi:hypothetical protein